MISEIKRVLAPGGLLILSTPNKKNYTDKTGNINPHHKKELYKDDLINLLKVHFKNIQIHSQQTMFSSVITSPICKFVDIYAGDAAAIYKQIDMDGTYFIAFASDANIPMVNASLFNGLSIYENVLREREQFVANSITYKTGHILLYPIKWAVKLLKKKQLY